MTAQSSHSRSVFLIGAAGGVGRRLTTLLTAGGDRVSGMYRSVGQDAAIRGAGGMPIPGDLVSDPVDALAKRLAGHDAVVFSAGAHGTGADMTTAIDGEGLRKAVEAARTAGVHRFLLVSVFMDALRDKPRSDGFEHYIAVKRQADTYLAGTDLDWLIVRPGTLLDAASTGQVNAGVAVPYGSIPRDDVAAFLAAALFDANLNRTAIEVTSGDVPIADAVSRLSPRPWRQ